MSGYQSISYVKSLSKLGEPIELTRSTGWLIKREIPETSIYDAMGPYPLFTCTNWDLLDTDFDRISDQVVSISLVTDPLGRYDVEDLRRIFPDVMLPFKKHYIVNLMTDWENHISNNHKRNIKHTAKNTSIEIVNNPVELLDEWTLLYDNLINRHNIKGITAFSRSSFQQQLQAKGVVAFRARCGGVTSGVLLFYTNGRHAYYHLGAYSDLGYSQKMSFGLFDFALKYLANAGVEKVNLGGGAGLENNDNDGLARFKCGWANDEATAWFCGRILDNEKYDYLVERSGAKMNGYFPAYRTGEFS